jgi:hypothetical protein
MGARLVVSLATVLLHGCSCSGDAPGNPNEGAVCELDTTPEGCGDACGPGHPSCAEGLYCDTGGECTADCVFGGSPGCSSGLRCTAWGRCLPDPTARDGAASLDGSGVCADVRLEGMRVTPTVIVIVDQSGSMTESFGGGDRWNVLRDSLLASDGLIRDLEGSVRFGLAMYSARSEDNETVMGECPVISSVPPALDNYDPIAGIYNPADPIDETDRCEEPNPQRGQAEAIAAVERAYSEGVRTYVISVGRDVSDAHLQDVANAGLGHGPGDPAAPYWVAGDDAGLRDALRSIVGGVLSCRVDLRGRIDVDMACTGTVRLNGTAIPCDDPNGWRAVDEDTIELQGDACDTLQMGTGATLEATFPCDVVLI